MYSNLDLYQSIKSLSIIAPTKLEECLSKANNSNQPLDKIILENDLISDENLGILIADLCQLPYIRLATAQLTKNICSLIPEAYARKNLCLVYKVDAATVYVAINNPLGQNLLDQLETRFHGKYKLAYATKKDILNALKVYADDPKAVFDKLLNTNIDQATKIFTEPPIIKIVDTILSFAYNLGASDIHLEPKDKETLVRFRVDGMMQDIIALPKSLHERLTTRIKVMANLRTDEAQTAQDGKLEIILNDEKVDIRVSFIPVIDGENIVMRLLSEKSRQFSMLDLGFSIEDAKKIDLAKSKPHGMILSTGPTGSGKTTTLYALLKLLNTRNITIMTIEDPVEYEIDGISQIQVNKSTGLTFADGLRSIVRQDPNIILVGEIRDNETADIAVNSAMTGHLVLSTLHTNDAATSIPRLTDMSIEPYLIASTFNLIIAQRLVRKICTQCRVSIEVSTSNLSSGLSSEIIAQEFKSPTIRLYKGIGCPFCNGLGYRGRIGIFETMPISDNIKDAIIKKTPAQEIQKIAIAEGMVTMLRDGLAKAKSGITTIEEVIRVTKE